MGNMILLTFIITIVVVIIMMKQIGKVTANIDTKSIENIPSIYASFASFIQEKIRAIKADIDHTKNTPSPLYILKDENSEEKNLEFLADNIRKLVFFETMNAKRKNPKEVEKELFNILSALDDFLNTYIQNGEKLADDLRDEFASEFQKMKN